MLLSEDGTLLQIPVKEDLELMRHIIDSYHEILISTQEYKQDEDETIKRALAVEKLGRELNIPKFQYPIDKGGEVIEDIYFINDDIKEITGEYTTKSSIKNYCYISVFKGTKVCWDDKQEEWIDSDGTIIPIQFVREDR